MFWQTASDMAQDRWAGTLCCEGMRKDGWNMALEWQD